MLRTSAWVGVLVLAARGGELGGAELFAAHGCGACHGAGGEGRALGPPLRGLAAHWERGALAAYLLDPAGAIAGDARLRALDESFPSEMLPYRNTTEAERLRLADFLLGLQ